MTFLVVGSGPAGIACAQGLLSQGVAVHMLDAGMQIEPGRAERVARMGRTAPGDWRADDRSSVTDGMAAGSAGIPLKLAFGSDFPYRDATRQLRTEAQGIGLQASLALGGLSNVWGAAMLPYVDRDLAEWPFAAARLHEHYRAVAALTGLSGTRDDLADVFPLFPDRVDELPPSRQAARLLTSLARHRGPLRAAGLTFGRSRLAVRGQRSGESGGCIACGACMYGCPYGFIYNSAATLADLRRSPAFHYEPDILVERVTDTADRAVVTGRHLVSGEVVERSAARVYLAAGVIPSTRILLQSLGAYQRPVTIKDSQYFLVPLMMLRSTPGVREESLHTLSQLFVEVLDPAISPFTVHLQVYSYNDLIGDVMRRRFGVLGRALAPLLRDFEGRLLVVQGYLHSTHSSSIRAELVEGAEGDRLELHAVINADARRVIGRVLRKLMRHGRRLGAVPLWPLLQIGEPGRGFHAGGSFPMRTTPGPLECDVLGRPAGWGRIHVVDATVFPTIAATTITFTAMANAHRIAVESARL